MPQHKNSRRYSLFSFFAGAISLVVILFLQPLDPMRFLGIALNISQLGGTSSPHAISTVAFWAAIAMFVFGLTGMLLSTLIKGRFDKAEPNEKPGQDSATDTGEENWIFI